MTSESPFEFAILITAPPLHSGGETAFQFIQAALKKGHCVRRIFFYRDGVYHGSRLVYSENPALMARWQILAKQHDLELVLCSASCARRGIMGKEQANYFEKDTDNLADNFCVASLSLWFEAVSLAERVIIFGETP
jgi:tRNA 2-thiouridine synthesizing protein D